MKVKIILLTTLLSIPSLAYSQESLVCSDGEVRSMIETARKAELAAVKNNEMNNKQYQDVRTNIEVNSEGGRERNSESGNCLAQTVPELREMMREKQQQIIAAYGAIKALMAGVASGSPIGFDPVKGIIFQPDEMCLLTSEDYEEILKERERNANNEFRNALADEMNKVSLEDYVNDTIFDRYKDRNESGKFGHEYIVWRNSGTNSQPINDGRGGDTNDEPINDREEEN